MVAKIHQGNTRPAIALLALLAYLAAPGFGIGPLTGALAQTPDDLDRAREHYEFAEFDQALAILARIIDRSGQTPQRLRDAYVLQARCQVGLGNRNLAEDSFCEALALDPDWRPDPIFFPRSEVEVFESARTGCPPVAATPEPTVKPVQPAPAPKTAKPWYMKPVVWAGAAAAVVVGVLVLGGGDDDDAGPPLPDPPPPPVRP